MDTQEPDKIDETSIDLPLYEKMYADKEFDKLLPLLIEEEEQSHDATVQFLIGKCYYYGKGAEKDDTQAAKWFSLSAKQKNVEASYYLGKMYSAGLGVPEDKKKAIKLLKFAGNREHIEAQYELGEIYCFGQDPGEDFEAEFTGNKWYEKAAKQGHRKARETLALNYLAGLEENFNKAAHWFSFAAKEGDVESILALAYIHSQWGNGRQAFGWYEKAAEQNDISAMDNIGDCYLEGFGVKQDYQEALRWFMKAAELGSNTATFRIGKMYEEGRGVKQDYEKAFALYKEAAIDEDDEAHFDLGFFYFNGLVGEKDIVKAVEHFEAAAKYEYPHAAQYLKLAKKELEKGDC